MCKRIFTRNEVKRIHSQSGLTRRDFGKFLAAAGVLGYIDHTSVALALSEDPRQLGVLSNQTAGREGTWALTDVEGEIPADLHGTLYRTAAGEESRFGTRFNHLFDGDAFVSAYSLRDGKAWLSTKFTDTPERVKEQAAGKMIYSEFGTKAPGVTGPQFKNQGSVNVISWDGRLLTLSEGGHPTAVDPQTLAFQSYWDFYGTLPPNVSFTAHPKYDPATGEGFAYGMEQGPSMALCVYRMDPDNGKLDLLHKIPQRGFFMLHDMFMTKDHFLFAIPPVKYNLGDLMTGRTTIADAISYFENEPLRILVMNRDGSGEASTVELPASMVFHNGNAFEQEDKLVLDSFLNPSGDVLKSLNSISKGIIPPSTPTECTRLVIDPANAEVVSNTVRGTNQEFPRFDIRQSGQDTRYLYVGEGDELEDALRFSQIVRQDLHHGKNVTAETTAERAIGEPVFTARSRDSAEDEGWILNLGYDGGRDETFLEIRDAATLDVQARLWTGTHLPLGFHGNFTPGWFGQEPA